MSSDEWYFFHPWKTYSVKTPAIRGSSGRVSDFGHSSDYDLDDDAEMLWDLGKKAFEALRFESLEDFENTDKHFWDWIDVFKSSFQASEQHISIFGPDGTPQKIDVLLDARPYTILMVIDRIKDVPTSVGFPQALFPQLALHCCLIEIREALDCLMLADPGAVSAAMNAQLIYQRGISAVSSIELEKSTRVRLATGAARARHARDPKQKEKLFVRKCFDAWQADPTRYKSRAAFARDMLDKNEHLENVKTIERWIREWSGEASNDD